MIRTLLAGVALVAPRAWAADKCPNLAGQFFIQGDDGRVTVHVTQSECIAAEMSWQRIPLGEPKKEIFRTDGQPSPSPPEIPENEATVVTATFTSDTLEVLTVSGPRKKRVNHTKKYSLTPAGDLQIQERMSSLKNARPGAKGPAYESTVVATRIRKPTP